MFVIQTFKYIRKVSDGKKVYTQCIFLLLLFLDDDFFFLYIFLEWIFMTLVCCARICVLLLCRVKMRVWWERAGKNKKKLSFTLDSGGYEGALRRWKKIIFFLVELRRVMMKIYGYTHNFFWVEREKERKLFARRARQFSQYFIFFCRFFFFFLENEEENFLPSCFPFWTDVWNYFFFIVTSLFFSLCYWTIMRRWKEEIKEISCYQRIIFG